MSDWTMFPTKQLRDELLAKMRTLGVFKVSIEFHGSGDSGNFEEARAVNSEGEEVAISDIKMNWPVRQTVWMANNRPKHTTNLELMSLSQIIEHLANGALDREGIDWYNNDGGQGTFTINFKESPPGIYLDVGQNYMETNEYAFEYTNMPAGDEACTPATTP